MLQPTDGTRQGDAIAAAERMHPRPRGNAILIAAYAVASLLLLWPAIYNGQAIFFFDTPAYFGGAARALKVVLGIDSSWLSHSSGRGDVETAIGEQASSLARGRGVSAGRSVYYGFLALLSGSVSLWLTLILQAGIILWALVLTTESLGARSRYLAPVLTSVLALLTTIPFFASYLMPDFLAGIAVLSLASLITCWHRIGFRMKAQWFMLLVLSLCTHTSHLAIAAAILPLGMLLTSRFLPKVPWSGALMIFAALATAGLMQAGVSLAVRTAYGQPYSNPPFLTARIAADPPGNRYLHETCPSNGFRVCDYLAKLPLDSDTFLWSRDPAKGVFGAAPPEVRQELADEQFRLALQVLIHEPGEMFLVGLNNAAKQFGMISIREFAYTSGLRTHLLNEIPNEFRDQLRRQRLFRQQMPLSSFDRVFVPISVISLAGVVIYLVLALFRPGTDPREREFCLFVLLVFCGLVVNALVTGVLSTPHDRYQARVIWLMPASLFMILAFKSNHLFFNVKERGSDSRSE